MPMTDDSFPNTPEEHLLLRLLRGDSLSACSLAGVNADALWRYAEAQGVSAALAGRLVQADAAKVFPALTNRARNSLRFTLTRNMALIELQRRIAEAFHEEHVPWLALKGPVFTEQFYGDLSLRPSADLDLLVAPSDVAAAHRALGRIGIDAKRPADPYRRFFGVTPHEHRYHAREPRILVELHWTATSACYQIVETHDLFARCLMLRQSTGEWPVFSVEDSVLYTVMHGLGHRWNHLLHILNLARVLEHTPSGTDWQYVLTTALQHRKMRALCLAFSLAHDLFHAPIPSDIEAIIHADYTLPPLRRVVWRSLAMKPRLLSALRVLLFKLRIFESVSDRAQLLLRAVAVATRRTTE